MILKKRMVLDGDTVLYGSATELRDTLDYDFSQERNFSYKGLNKDEIIHHLAIFVSRLWQIHIFGEGNTRTTAVFFIKYLRSLGFEATNDIFAENAWYFRNALVRANYNNFNNDIYKTTEYLELFLRNLLLNEKNELHISGLLKADIEDKKANIEKKLAIIDSVSNSKTVSYILALFEECGTETVFGRSLVQEVTGLKSTRASELIMLMKNTGLIVPVEGHGKGKYHFI